MSFHLVELSLVHVFHVEMLECDLTISPSFSLGIVLAPGDHQHLLESQQPRRILLPLLAYLAEVLVHLERLRVVVGLLREVSYARHQLESLVELAHLLQYKYEEEAGTDIDHKLVEVIYDANYIVNSIEGINPAAHLEQYVRSVKLSK